MPSKNLLGGLLASHRHAQGLSQQDVAERVKMSRENYSQLETGRRKEPPTPQQAIALSKLLQIPMLPFVNAMGYPVEAPGFEDEEEVAFLQAFRQLTPDQKKLLYAAVGLESPTELASPSTQRLRRIADRPGPRYSADSE